MSNRLKAENELLRDLLAQVRDHIDTELESLDTDEEDDDDEEAEVDD